MPLKKDERKQAYREIIALMLEQEHEKHSTRFAQCVAVIQGFLLSLITRSRSKPNTKAVRNEPIQTIQPPMLPAGGFNLLGSYVLLWY